MSLFKRISATITTGADRTVARFENHEAIAGVALDEASRAVADARAVARRHERDAEALAAERARAAADVGLWTRRARERAADDETAALACLGRRRDADERLRALDARIAAHATGADALRDRVRRLERAHAELAGRRDALARRQTLARAERVLAESAPRAHRIDATLERWETAVDADELRGAAAPDAFDVDASRVEDLGDRLAREERDRALREELAALRGEAGPTGADDAGRAREARRGGGRRVGRGPARRADP